MLFHSVLDAVELIDPGARVGDSVLDGDSAHGKGGVSQGCKGS